MRFIVDECTGPSVARWLREHGHDVVSIFDEARGCDEVSILRWAVREDRILITNDKDFGDHVFRDHLPHKGVILLRLSDSKAASKIAAPQRLLADHLDRLPGRFAVVTEKSIRIVVPPTVNGSP